MGFAAVAVWLLLNWTYQVVRKPSELLFPVAGVLYKTPAETWRVYAPLFNRHSTDLVGATLLAALAQAEGTGNPIARTYWRWSFDWHPFEIYRPASSAVGMYQMTDGTFDEARRYCIRNHAVARQGHWYEWRSCWFNALYMRVVPSHAVELTAAHLHRHTARLIARHGLQHADRRRKEMLAAVIHLCGPGGGAAFARRGLVPGGQRCGDHGVAAYLARVQSFRETFERLAAGRPRA